MKQNWTTFLNSSKNQIRWIQKELDVGQENDRGRKKGRRLVFGLAKEQENDIVHTFWPGFPSNPGMPCCPVGP